jgi:RecT family protein
MNDTAPNNHPEFLTKDEIDLLKRTMLKQFSPDDQEFFIRLCIRQHIDPFRKPPQIYPTLRAGQLVPITSINLITAQAISTGKYNGCEIFWADDNGEWRNEWLDDRTHPLAAKAVVHHKDRDYPEIAIARWKSYSAQGPFWSRMDDLMLAKCAKALALRAAFADATSGLYISEELQGGLDETLLDQQKVADIQRHDQEVRIHPPPAGARFVEEKPTKRPAPAEALEPAFPEEDLGPQKTFAEKLAQDFPEKEQPPQPDEEMDFLTEQKESPAPPKEDLWWKDHVIKGLPRSPDLQGKKVGELTHIQILKIEQRWIPTYYQQQSKATPEQTADLKAFEARIAHDRSVNPLQ